MGILGAGLIIGSIVAGLASAGASAYSAKKNSEAQSEANETNEEYAEKNLQLQQEQLNYQKYLNNNQIQMQAADALKAGINPIALHSGQLSAGSYSNVDANQSWNNVNGVDFSGLSSALEKASGIYTEKQMNDDTLANQKSIATMQSNTARYVADRQAETELYKWQNESANSMAQTSIARDSLEWQKDNAKVVNRLAEINANANQSNANTNSRLATIQEMDSLYQNDLRNIQSEQLKNALDLQKQIFDSQVALYKEAVRQKKWDRANMIWNNINNSISSAARLLGAVNGVSTPVATNQIGF